MWVLYFVSCVCCKNKQIIKKGCNCLVGMSRRGEFLLLDLTVSSFKPRHLPCNSFCAAIFRSFSNCFINSSTSLSWERWRLVRLHLVQHFHPLFSIDSLPSSFIHFKHSALCLIINQSINTGIFPNSLKLAIVKPLFKHKDSEHSFGNYRPISLLTTISKVWESYH